MGVKLSACMLKPGDCELPFSSFYQGAWKKDARGLATGQVRAISQYLIKFDVLPKTVSDGCCNLTQCNGIDLNFWWANEGTMFPAAASAGEPRNPGERTTHNCMETDSPRADEWPKYIPTDGPFSPGREIEGWRGPGLPNKPIPKSYPEHPGYS